MTDKTEAPELKPDWEGFGRDLMEEWPYRDIEGYELFGKALEHGLIKGVAGGYDPDEHIDDEGICPEVGDPWYEYNFQGTRTDACAEVTDPDLMELAHKEIAALAHEAGKAEAWKEARDYGFNEGLTQGHKEGFNKALLQAETARKQAHAAGRAEALEEAARNIPSIMNEKGPFAPDIAKGILALNKEAGE